MRVVCATVSGYEIALKLLLRCLLSAKISIFLWIIGVKVIENDICLCFFDDFGERFKICVFDSFHAFQGFQELLFRFGTDALDVV